MRNADELLTPAEVRDLLKVSRTTMHRWHTAGRLVPVKLTERVFRYRRSDVDRLMDAK